MRECDESPPSRLLEGIAQFNRGEYFEQHETLEPLWRAERRKVRHLYQGILQIGVAFHHLRRRNYHGTVYMLTRGTRYLAPFSPRCQGVDVEKLLADATAVPEDCRTASTRSARGFQLATRADCPLSFVGTATLGIVNRRPDGDSTPHAAAADGRCTTSSGSRIVHPAHGRAAFVMKQSFSQRERLRGRSVPDRRCRSGWQTLEGFVPIRKLSSTS